MMRTQKTVGRLAILGADYRLWYADANKQIRALPWPAIDTCGVLAITSPKVHVTTSTRATLRLLTDGSRYPGLMSRSFDSACRWLRGDRKILIGDEASKARPKISSFYKALMGSSSAIVIDSWILHAFGLPNARPRVKQAAHVKRVIGRIAVSHGWEPSEAQAAVWAGIVKQSGRNVPTIQLAAEFAKI